MHPSHSKIACGMSLSCQPTLSVYGWSISSICDHGGPSQSPKTSNNGITFNRDTLSAQCAIDDADLGFAPCGSHCRWAYDDQKTFQGTGDTHFPTFFHRRNIPPKILEHKHHYLCKIFEMGALVPMLLLAVYLMRLSYHRNRLENHWVHPLLPVVCVYGRGTKPLGDKYFCPHSQ